MPATSYTRIADEIVARLATVTNVGIVHRLQRNFTSDEDFKANMLDRAQGCIAGWYVSRESFSDTPSSNIENTRVSQWVLRGFRSVKDNDESEITFQQVIDDICAEFRPQSSLGGSVELTKPLQARVIGYSTVHGVFCHLAELTMAVQEFYTS